MTVLNDADAIYYRVGQLGGGAASRVYAGPTQVWPPVVSAYRAAILATPGLVGYWRLGAASNAEPLLDEQGIHWGEYANGPILGVPGAIVGDADTAMRSSAQSGSGVVRGPLMRINGELPVWRGVELGVDPHAMNLLDLGDGPLTLEAWIVAGPPGGPYRGIISKGGGAYYYRLDGNNRLRAVRSAVADMGGTVNPVPSAGWHHVVMTKHGAAIRLYIDGLDDTGPMTNHTFTDNDGWLGLGCDNQAEWIGESLFGDLDEAAVYSVVLTPAQVLEHTIAGGRQQLVNNEGPSGSAYDASTVGIRFRAAAAGELVALRYWHTTGALVATGKTEAEHRELTHRLTLWDAAGAMALEVVDACNNAPTGWRTVHLATPFPIVAGATYSVAFWGAGWYYGYKVIVPSASPGLTIIGGCSAYGVNGYPVNLNAAHVYLADVVYREVS